ncbi:MAG TPA: aminopeptidase [Phycisphaerales bacterium]|nr:aminopeptidase [Phycisphaerales bacterium]
MRDPRLDKLADVLVNFSTKVKPGDLVAIAAEPIAMPLTEAVAEKVLKAGGNPFWLPRSEQLTEVLLTHGSDDQIRYCSPLMVETYKTIDVQISFWTQLNTKYLGKVDPQKAALLQQARRPWFKEFMNRSARKEFRWVGTAFPTNASAQDADMSLTQYENFVFEACYLHLPDPVAKWKSIYETQERVREYLQKKKVVRFRVPGVSGPGGHDGTDLTVNVDGSTWINCFGESNFPDGEVFAGPKGVDGHVNYTYPALYNGREVEGVRLVFKGGRVVDASAKKNEAFLIKMLDQDAGARVLGEIAIGTNYAIKDHTKNILFDEKIGGTFHAAVGAGYPESGNSNESGLHWDMICDLRKGGTIEADGEVFHKDGLFLKEGWPRP